MNTRNVLKAFGLTLWRTNGRWFACRPTEGPAFSECSASTARELVQMIVPPPPTVLSPRLIESWAEECLRSCYCKPDPQTLAKAAFEAYGSANDPEAIKVFADSVRAWIIE